LVAPGFGSRGVKGKLRAIEFARVRRLPFLGICFGMQLACVEFARHVCGLPDAMTSEVDEATADPVIDFLPEQRNLELMGGTMRLGAYDCKLEPETLAARAYGTLDISERHRHRYEFNNKYKALFEEHGMVFSGHHVVGRTTLVECVELAPSLHPWFVGTQAHPEFKSRPTRPSPLYRDFVGAALSGAAHELRRDSAAGSPVTQPS
jgi:CTP synthase